MKTRGWLSLVTVVGTGAGRSAAGPPTFTITLGGRTACVTPATKHFARAEGGAIDVQIPATGVLVASLTGCVAANANLAQKASAIETFHLIQEFEISCSDANVSQVALTLDSALVGFVRSKHKGGACVRLASAVVAPEGFGESPLSVTFPPQCVAGTGAQLCNQHVMPITIPSLPLGRFVLAADFVIEADAAGLCDGHAAADFSPTAALPADFVRLRDPFQNADKKSFGFSITLTAAPANSPIASRPGDAKVTRASPASAPRQIPSRPVRAAFESARGPFHH